MAITTIPHPSTAVLKAPGMEPFKVPLQLEVPGGEPMEGARGTVVQCVVWGWEGHGINEGPEAAEWFSRFCGREVRLLRVDAGEAWLNRQLNG